MSEQTDGPATDEPAVEDAYGSNLRSSQRTMVSLYKELFGRRVRSFTSALDTEEDVAVETFMFYPRGSEGPSRAEMAGN